MSNIIIGFPLSYRTVGKIHIYKTMKTKWGLRMSHKTRHSTVLRLMKNYIQAQMFIFIQSLKCHTRYSDSRFFNLPLLWTPGVATQSRWPNPGRSSKRLRNTALYLPLTSPTVTINPQC